MNADRDKIEFLDPNNDCGQSLLKLVAAGSSIIAELQRLSNYIPDVFLHEPTSSPGQLRLAQELQEASQQAASKQAKAPPPKDAKKVDKTTAKVVQHSDQAQQKLEAQLMEETMKL